MELELRKRLKWLTEAQLRLAAFGNVEERTAISWLAALKSSAFIYAFASEVLRSKLAALDPILRSSDYEAFFENQCVRYPRILTLTSSSRVKVRSVLLKMCSEVGIGTRFGRELHIRRPSVPLAVVAAITADSPQWLSGFLIPDSEIPLI